MARVQSSITYKPDTGEMTVRAWVEDLLRILDETPLVLATCGATLLDESGAVLQSVVGVADSAGTHTALFRLTGLSLQTGKNNILILVLRTAVETHGPRTIGIPVN